MGHSQFSPARFTMGKHTIVLMQETQRENSRTFSDYETVTAAMEGIRQHYEKRLSKLNPQVRHISYDISELNAYLDSMGDLSCLVFDDSKGAYEPHGRDWIKKRILRYLNQQSRGTR